VDGSLAIVPVDDPEPAADRIHVAGDTGRFTIAPRLKETPPAILVQLGPRPPKVAPFGETDFLSCADGRSITHLQPDGTSRNLPIEDHPVETLVPLSDGAVAISSGGSLVRFSLGECVSRDSIVESGFHGPFSVSADGRWVLRNDGGLTLGSMEDPSSVADKVTDLDTSEAVFSPDGNWLAAPLISGGLAIIEIAAGRIGQVIRIPNYPTTVRSVSWDAASNLLATSGAYRIIVWPIDQFSGDGGDLRSLPTGRTGLSPIDIVAVNSSRPLVAAGHENGAIVVARPGSKDELLVRLPGGDSVSALDWSRDGKSLAFATSSGQCGILGFPSQLFK
jgi:WD40 repeat protein